MNRAELRTKLNAYIVAIENLERNYKTCIQIGTPANIAEVINIKDLAALKDKFQRLLKENPTDSTEQVSFAVEGELLADQNKIVGTEESAYRKFLAAVMKETGTPEYPEAWLSDSQLQEVQDNFDGVALGGWTTNGYNTVIQNIRANATDKKASEEFATLFPDYIEARKNLVARVGQIRQAHSQFIAYKKVADGEKKQYMDAINDLLGILEHTHGVKIEDTPPFAGMMRDTSTLDATLRRLLVPASTDDMVKAFTPPKKACIEQLVKLMEVRDHLQILVDEKTQKKERDEALDSLIAHRPDPKFADIDTGLKRIKDNHKKYLEETMVTHLDTMARGKYKSTQLKEIKIYAEGLVEYGQKPTTKAYLDQSITQLSTLAKLGGGALAALLGVGVGGATFFTAKTGFLTGMINPFAGVQNVLTGAASAGLGVGIGYLTYELWKNSQQGVAVPDFKIFQAELRAAKLDTKYDDLARGMVKLFHLRECLLLNSTNNTTNAKMRDEFARDLAEKLPKGTKIDDKALNIAIEAYFLQQLNVLFDEGFKEIYKFKDQEIQQEREQYPFVTWFKNLFADPAKREEFTQQLQIQFMTQTMAVLQHQMDEPGFLAAHPAFTATVSGLIAATVVLGVAAAVVGGPITLGILSIALIAAAVTAAANYLAVNKIDALHYKRDKSNRASLNEASGMVGREIERLQLLIASVKETSPEDVRELQSYQANTYLESVTALVRNLPYLGGAVVEFVGAEQRPSYTAVGSSDSWYREQASRYRHSKQSEIDLADEHRRIIGKAMEQTKLMQESLVDMLAGRDNNHLRYFIVDTTASLQVGKAQDFIKKFELKEKIRQQVLEIVAIAPPSVGPLPPILVDFYTKQLGGSAQDLELARTLAPVVSKGTRQDAATHPLKAVLEAAVEFNRELVDKGNPHILRGDPTYRDILGLKVEREEDRIEHKIDSSNVQTYLDNSYEFLLSFLKHDDKAILDTPYQLSEAFIVYRTLLIKQLATLADPNNQHVGKGVRSAIEKFVREKLDLDPKVVFNNALNQALFVDGGGVKQMENSHHELCSVAAVTDVTKAIMTDLAYDSAAVITPKTLIEKEAREFLSTVSVGTMFAYGNAAELRPEGTSESADEINAAIDNTREFIAAIEKHSTLVESGARGIYIKSVISHIEAINKQIAAQDKTGTNTHLTHVKQALTTFAAELKNPQPVKKVEKPVTVTVSREDGLNDFIADVKKLGERLEDNIKKLQPQVDRNGFFKPPTPPTPPTLETLTAQLDAARNLVDALEALQSGEEVDQDFLAHNAAIYKNDDLGGLIKKHVTNMNVKSLQNLFDESVPSQKLA